MAKARRATRRRTSVAKGLEPAAPDGEWDRDRAAVFYDQLLEQGHDKRAAIVLAEINGKRPPARLVAARLGRLEGAVEVVSTRYGLPDVVNLPRLHSRVLRRLIGAPEWVSVRCIRFLRGERGGGRYLAPDETSALITSPAMRSLEELHEIDPPTFAALAIGRPLPSITTISITQAVLWSRGLLEQTSEALPNLTDLSLEGALFGLLQNPAIKQAQTLRVRLHFQHDIRDLGFFLDLGQLRSIDVSTRHSEEVSGRRDANGWHLRMRIAGNAEKLLRTTPTTVRSVHLTSTCRGTYRPPMLHAVAAERGFELDQTLHIIPD